MGGAIGDLGGLWPGVSKLVSVQPGIESSTSPGKLSVVSEPLGHLTDFMRLWTGVGKWMKKGRDIPDKSTVVLEHSRFFIVAQLVPRSSFPLIPKNTPTNPLSPPGQDLVAVHTLHFAERQKRLLRAEATCNSHVLAREHFIFHEDPLCVEAWGEMPGLRFAGAWLRGVVQTTLDGILARACTGEVKPRWVYANIEEPVNSGLMTVVSDSLEGYISFERLWVEWLDVLKYPNSVGGPVKSVELDVQTESDFNVRQVVDGSEAEMLWCDKGSPGTEVTDLKKVNANEKLRTIHIEHFLEKGDTPRRYWIRFMEKDLRVQAWAESPGLRIAGEDFAKHVEKMLNSVLALEDVRIFR